jgi:hypothetical protein
MGNENIACPPGSADETIRKADDRSDAGTSPAKELARRRILLDSVIDGTGKVAAGEWDRRTYSAVGTQKECRIRKEVIPRTTPMLPKLSRNAPTPGLLYLSLGSIARLTFPLKARNPKEPFFTYGVSNIYFNVLSRIFLKNFFTPKMVLGN